MISAIAYGGWQNCYRLTAGEIEAVVTTDIGPRVIRCGFTGGQNLFKEFPDQLGKRAEDTWQPRGGHRLWLAPESRELSYGPDNDPVESRIEGDTITLRQRPEPQSGIEKEIAVTIKPGGYAVVHRIRNTGTAARCVAPWALTMMAPGGTSVAPFPPSANHQEALQPTHPLVMWAYTNFSDPRWKFTPRHLILRQDPAATSPVKAGLWNRRTWQAYLLGSDLFIKSTTAVAGPEAYPDFGCSLETFTNQDFLEMETLGPLHTLQPGESATHAEHWSLHRDIRIAAWNDDEIDRAIASLV